MKRACKPESQGKWNIVSYEKREEPEFLSRNQKKGELMAYGRGQRDAQPPFVRPTEHQTASLTGGGKQAAWLGKKRKRRAQRGENEIEPVFIVGRRHSGVGVLMQEGAS